eukprot:scaffold16_cov242-Pinguiococcus_pyrenoidosus.AAC.5
MVSAPGQNASVSTSNTCTIGHRSAPEAPSCAARSPQAPPATPLPPGSPAPWRPPCWRRARSGGRSAAALSPVGSQAIPHWENGPFIRENAGIPPRKSAGRRPPARHWPLGRTRSRWGRPRAPRCAGPPPRGSPLRRRHPAPAPPASQRLGRLGRRWRPAGNAARRSADHVDGGVFLWFP